MRLARSGAEPCLIDLAVQDQVGVCGREGGREREVAHMNAAEPQVAEPLYERFCASLRALGVPVETGVFGARMRLDLANQGPVTIVLDGRATGQRS